MLICKRKITTVVYGPIGESSHRTAEGPNRAVGPNEGGLSYVNADGLVSSGKVQDLQGQELCARRERKSERKSFG